MLRKLDLRGCRSLLDPRKSQGYAIAELAVVLPAIVMVAFIGLWGMSVGATNIKLRDMTMTIARSAARGDAVSDQIDSAHKQGIDIHMTTDSELVHVDAMKTVSLRIPIFNRAIDVSASSTALLESLSTGA